MTTNARFSSTATANVAKQVQAAIACTTMRLLATIGIFIRAKHRPVIAIFFGVHLPPHLNSMCSDFHCSVCNVGGHSLFSLVQQTRLRDERISAGTGFTFGFPFSTAFIAELVSASTSHVVTT